MEQRRGFLKSRYEKRYDAYVGLDYTLIKLGLIDSHDMYDACRDVYLDDAMRKAGHVELAFKVSLIAVLVLAAAALVAVHSGW